MKDFQLLFNNFDYFSRSYDGIKKLREMILQLAIQGKLVEQDPKDEPASVLLEKIQAKKEKLFKNGRNQRIKLKNYDFPKIENQNIPHGWKATLLGEILTLEYGKGIPKDTNHYIGSIPAYGANGIKKYVNKPLIESKAIIIGRKGSAGAINISDKPCWPLDVTYYVIPTKLLNFKYCFYILNNLRLPELARGIKPGLNRNDVYRKEILLPPLNEQKRIVSKIDSLFSLCNELEDKLNKQNKTQLSLNRSSLQLLTIDSSEEVVKRSWPRVRDNFDTIIQNTENVKELKDTILQLAIQGKLVEQDPKDEPASVLLEKIQAKKEKLIEDGKIKKSKELPPINPVEIPFEIPESWEWTRLGLLGISQTGSTPSTSKPELFGNDVPFITPADIHDYGIEINNRKLSKLGFERGRQIPKNSVLMVCIGTVGKINYIECQCSCNQQINSITPFTGISHILLSYFLKSPYIQKKANELASKTTLKILNKSKWESLILPIPSPYEQQRIVTKIDSLFQKIAELEDRLDTQAKLSEIIAESIAKNTVSGI